MDDETFLELNEDEAGLVFCVLYQMMQNPTDEFLDSFGEVMGAEVLCRIRRFLEGEPVNRKKLS
jgi:hypothetical protein